MFISILIFEKDVLKKIKTDDIMKNMIKKAGSSQSPAILPIPKQIFNSKAYQKRNTLATGDTFQNISLQHPDFVQHVEWSPRSNDNIFFILALDEQLLTLRTHSHTIFVDGTFDCVQQKLILTVFMVKVRFILNSNLII